MKIEVSKCVDCPLIRYEQDSICYSSCNHPYWSNRDWRLSQLERADVIPESCPLREDNLVIEIAQSNHMKGE